MPSNKQVVSYKDYIQSYRGDMVLEVLQLILTDAGWCKPDLADYLEIDCDYLNKLLTHRHYPASSCLMYRIKQLCQQNYGYYRWYIIYQQTKQCRHLNLNQDCHPG